MILPLHWKGLMEAMNGWRMVEENVKVSALSKEQI